MLLLQAREASLGQQGTESIHWNDSSQWLEAPAFRRKVSDHTDRWAWASLILSRKGAYMHERTSDTA
jgi:hypothetical protein